MTTQIDTIEDLMRVLDTKPEWLEALRARLLTRELLALPQILADFIETTNRRFEEIDRRFDGVDSRFEEMDRRFDGVDSRFEEIDRRFDGVDSRFEEMDRRFDGVDDRFEGIDRHLQRLGDEIGVLKGFHTRNEAMADIPFLSRDMGMAKMRRLWSKDDIGDLIESSDTAGISRNDLLSFRQADAIVEAIDHAGRTCYITAEISFTVNGRDTRRAIRNAEYMTRFTGELALPAVMGVRVDQQVLDIIESGRVYWYRVDPTDLVVE